MKNDQTGGKSEKNRQKTIKDHHASFTPSMQAWLPKETGRSPLGRKERPRKKAILAAQIVKNDLKKAPQKKKDQKIVDKWGRKKPYPENREDRIVK